MVNNPPTPAPTPPAKREPSAPQRPRRRILLALASKTSLPADALAGAPRVTLTGPNRLLVENHRGLLNLEDDCVIVSVGRGSLTIRGAGLRLDCMNPGELLITGKIAAIELD